MATWSTDFSELNDANDIAAQGWTRTWEEWASSHPTVVIDATVAPVSDRYITRSPTSFNSHRHVAYTPPTLPGGGYTRMNVLACVRRSGLDASPGVIPNGQGTGTDRTGIAGVLRNNDTAEVRYYEWDGTDSTASSGVAHGIADTLDWVWMRVDLNGSNLRIKAWQDGETEPGAYQLDTTVTEDAVGWPGINLTVFSGTGPTQQFGYFAWGTDEDAPLPLSAGIAHARTIRSTTVGTLS